MAEAITKKTPKNCAFLIRVHWSEKSNHLSNKNKFIALR